MRFNREYASNSYLYIAQVDDSQVIEYMAAIWNY